MSNTYEICDVTVTLPALGSVISDSAGNKGHRGEKCRVNLYAVHPNWREKGSTFDGIMVGRTTFEGYTASPYNRTLRIMMPHGYKLVALRVDERDQPESWDSLPVHFSGGYIRSQMQALNEIPDALDTVLARYHEQFGNTEPDNTAVVFLADRWVAFEGSYTPDEMRDAVEYITRKRKEKSDAKAMAESSPFAIKEGQVFIKDAIIQNVQMSRNETELRKGYAINVGIAPEIKSRMKLSPEMEKAISQVVSAELKKNLQPGGTIWTSLRRGI